MVEITRMVADWLSGTTLDVSAASQAVTVHLAAMTYDGSDTAPALTGGVVDETRDAKAARNEPPDTLPALVVTLTDLRMDAAAMVSAAQLGTAQVFVWYASANATSDDGLRDALYVMRAVRRSLERLHRGQEANNGRKRNNIAIVAGTDPMTLSRVQLRQEDSDVATGLMITYDLWDLDV